MENDILYARLVELANQKPLPQHQATACLVTPILVKGSLPRHRYARMIISPSKHPSATNAINPCPCPGEECVSEGTIGGGNAELMAHSAALEVVSSGIPQKQVFKYDTPEDVKQGDKTPKGAIETGAVCGGAMTVLFEPVGLRSERVAKPQREIFAETLKSLKAGKQQLNLPRCNVSTCEKALKLYEVKQKKRLNNFHIRCLFNARTAELVSNCS
eukprot:GCRY01002399.1.p1 GENE.GCRY01002399.1~~GCRY01002399.1.p1  ORF type:complete len:215 (-),score=11.93 GCRY01002399.1:482-1126(-)